MLGSDLFGHRPDRRVDLVAALRCRSSHISVSIALRHPGALDQPRVVAVGPVREDDRRALEALDEHAALVVHREVHRADHAVAPARAQPALGGGQQRRGGLRVVLALEEAEQAPGVVLELVEDAVDLRGDAPDRAAVAPGEEVLGLAVLEERVLLRSRNWRRSETSGGTQFGSLR